MFIDSLPFKDQNAPIRHRKTVGSGYFLSFLLIILTSMRLTLYGKSCIDINTTDAHQWEQDETHF